jgi:hypothetical protein
MFLMLACTCSYDRIYVGTGITVPLARKLSRLLNVNGVLLVCTVRTSVPHEFINRRGRLIILQAPCGDQLHVFQLTQEGKQPSECVLPFGVRFAQLAEDADTVLGKPVRLPEIPRPAVQAPASKVEDKSATPEPARKVEDKSTPEPARKVEDKSTTPVDAVAQPAALGGDSAAARCGIIRS